MNPATSECTTQVQVFDNEEFGAIRALQIDGEPWFVAKDVCDALDIKNSRDALARLDEDEKGVASTDTPGGIQKLQAINEPGLYTLVLSSRKPEARAFKRWITHEVIPSIRRHGMYATPQAAEAMLADPDVMIATLQALKAERAKGAELAAANAEMAPKALFADAVAASDRCILVGDLAKLLKQNGYNTGQRRLFARLHEDGYLMWSAGKHMPTQRAMEQGLFKLKEHSGLKPDGSGWSTVTVTVTGKGQVHFINRYCKDRIPRNQRVMRLKTA